MEGQDVLPRQPLVQRMLGGPRRERGQQLRVPAQPQPYVRQVQLRRVPLRGQGLAHPVDPGGVEARARLAAPPQVQGLADQGGGALVVRGAGAGQEVAEAVQVHRLRRCGQHIAAVPADERRGAARRGEDGAQPREVRVQGAPRPLRRPLAPHPLDQLVERDQPARVHQQRRQDGTLPRMPDRDRSAAGDAHLDIA
nr:hypothetical protein [Streptomyces boncukensis]